MNKPYLLIAGQGYYPSAGTDDWIGCFATEKEAQDCITITKEDVLFKQGPRKGKVKGTINHYKVLKDGQQWDVDWYEIVNLKDWTL